MYYWLQYTEQTEYYVISDQDDIVYLIEENVLGEIVASKQKMDKNQLLRFMPYFEIVKESNSFDVDYVIG